MNREDAARTRVLDKLVRTPKTAAELTPPERKQLRFLEKAGLIKCSGDPDYTWCATKMCLTEMDERAERKAGWDPNP